LERGRGTGAVYHVEDLSTGRMAVKQRCLYHHKGKRKTISWIYLERGDKMKDAIDNLARVLQKNQYFKMLMEAEQVKMRQGSDAAKPFFDLAVKYRTWE